MQLVFNKLSEKQARAFPIIGSSVKKVIQEYFWAFEQDIFLKDDYDGSGDGLYKFEVGYNYVYDMYKFTLIGGTRFKKKGEDLRNWFTEQGYKVSDFTHTWKWEGERKHSGIYFWVHAKEPIQAKASQTQPEKVAEMSETKGGGNDKLQQLVDLIKDLKAKQSVGMTKLELTPTEEGEGYRYRVLYSQPHCLTTLYTLWEGTDLGEGTRKVNEYLQVDAQEFVRMKSTLKHAMAQMEKVMERLDQFEKMMPELADNKPQCQ